MKLLVMRLVAIAVLVGAVGACNKPAEDDCRKALTNMQKLLGTEDLSHNNDFEGEVRRCRGGSSKEAVECAMKASSVDALKACKFMAAAPTN